MKKFYMIPALALALGMSMSADAIERPKTGAGAPEDGGKYILVNAYNPTGYMSRTSWDGALYFLGKDDSNYANYALTAKKNADGTWSFTKDVLVDVKADTTFVEGVDTVAIDTIVYDSIYAPSYCLIRAGVGAGNLNMDTIPASWTITEGTIDGFYHMIAGEGNVGEVQGLKLHLNGGAQYFVISEPTHGGGWYPDYAGGTVVIPDEEVESYFDRIDAFNRLLDESGRCVMADSTSENWAFIKVEDVPAHMAMYGVYSIIKDFEDICEALEGPLTGGSVGFGKTMEAVMAIYNGEAFNAEADTPIIKEMIDKKKEFYNVLCLALELENPTEDLTNAINAAVEVFETKTEATEVEVARAALMTAVNEFNQGAGDYTSFGVNMSFEDLSAQNGSVTSGVAAPPFGWSIIINGDTVTTVDDVKAHGITAWHGVNADCVGDVKDGQYGFGLWTNGVPEYQISQTITGLDNGTYVVSAGLMVGANNNGSRRTTQRIFGNLNATYFGSEYEYDLAQLDNSEVYAFQGNSEPTTDTEMQPVEVRAYVYDGTLTFGLRTDANIAAALRESGNGAGGDGWFKIDNFRIMKEGYVGADAAAVANHYVNAVADYTGEKLEQALLDKLDAVLEGVDEVSADEDPAKINEIITTLKGFIPEAQASIAAYISLADAIDAAYQTADAYMAYAGIGEYLSVIDDAYAALEDGTLDVAGIEATIEGFADALLALEMSGIAVGDYMNIIQNPSFEDLSAQGNTGSGGPANVPVGWKLNLNGVDCKTTADYGAAGASLAWCAINNGDPIDDVDEQGTSWTTQYTEGEHLWGIWAENIPEVELYQEFTGIPAGTYILSCDLVCPWDWAGDGVTTQRIFANEFVQMYGTEEAYASALNITEDMKNAMAKDAANPDADLKHMNYAGYVNTGQDANGSSRCPHPMSLKFGVDSTGVMKIGFRTNNVAFDGTVKPHNGAGWFKLDNFKLFYESEDIPTSIDGVETSGKLVEVVGQKFYTIDGREVAQPQRGINIIKNIMSDGSVEAVKVLK